MTSRRSSRSAARIRDPIVLSPGFGTQKDVEKLSQELGLSQQTVVAIMECRGRGIRSSRGQNDDDEDDKKPAAAVSTAWADFMKEEGMGEEEEDDDVKDDDVDKETAKYKLPLNMPWFESTSSATDDDDSKPLSKKQKPNPPRSGILVQSGTLDSTTIGRKRAAQLDPNVDLMVPTVLSTSLKIKSVVTGCNAAHAFAITTQGHVYGWGRNEASQLTHKLPKNVPLPTRIEVDAVICSGAVGKSHSVLLDEEGQLWSCGYNKLGQCSIKSFLETVPLLRKCIIGVQDINMVQVSCGEHFTAALSDQGELYTCGSSEFGQLANGETGEYFVTASKLAFTNCNILTKRTTYCQEVDGGASGSDTKVEPLLEDDVRLGYIACGKHHTIAIEAERTTSGKQQQRRIVSWGCGDYGCLGHGIQKDEYYPRVLTDKILGNPVQVSAGAQCGMVLTQNGHVYYWGKHRSVGEATMRPSLLEALANNGHVVTHVRGGSQSVVCCTNQAVTIAWGQGPHGELGFGPNRKSSAKPDFVTALDKCRVLDMACGYGTTVYCILQEDKQDEEAIAKLETVDEEAVRGALGE